MTKVFGAHDLLLSLVAWRKETTNPNAGAGTSAAIGSFWQQSGASAEMFLKTGSGDKGWTKQNTVNLDIYNVKTFGALGDGVTNDNVAIQAAINAAQANGGGTVYFPPGTYAIYRIVGPLSTFEMGNKANITFMGDGYASTIQMTGDAALATWYAFRIYDRSQRIAFKNLRLLGNTFTNPNAAGQNFFIQISSSGADVGPPHDIDITGVWFDPILVGAAIRIIGEIGFEPYNIRLNKNIYNIGDGGAATARSALEGQRHSVKVQSHFNWMTGAKNSLIDCEPSGDHAPLEWSHIGNHLLYNGNSDTQAAAFGGFAAAEQQERTIFAFNTITNGGNIAAGYGSNLEIRGNIVVMAAGTVFAESVLYLFHNGGNLLVQGNIFISPNATALRFAIHLTGDATGEGKQNSINDNICSAVGTTAISGIEITGNTEINVNGNIVSMNVSTANVSDGMKLRSTSQVGDHWVANGNLIVATNAALLAGIEINTGGNFDIRNVTADYNHVRNSVNAILFGTSAGKLFLDGRACNNNFGASLVTATIGLPTTNVGATFEGNAGKGAQIFSQALAAGAEGQITSTPGSMNANQSGLAGAVIQYKESGTGTAGWFGWGSSEIVFGARALSTATAARFLAPGSDLAVETAVVVQMAMPRAGNIRNWRLKCTAGVGVATITYTMRKNGVSQSGPLAVANTATTGTTAVSFAVVAGDLISVQVTKSVAPGTPQTDVEITFELTS